MAASLVRLRAALHRQLAPESRPRGLSPLNSALAVAILLSVTAGLLETEPAIAAGRAQLFRGLEAAFATVFAVEYALRFWTAAEQDHPGGGWRARWRWVRSPWALLDLIVLLSTALAGFGPAYLLRLFRLARILRLAKLGRFSQAWSLLAGAVQSRRYELALTAMAAGFVLLTAATLLYLVEGPVQPDKFGSVPRALWWSAVTLTTIGYGDVYPVTPLGKVLAGLTAIVGVGLIATPAGVLAAALSDALQRRREPGE
jgi:voltage-gated potassium channel